MSRPPVPAPATAQTRSRVTISGQLTRTGAQPSVAPVAHAAPAPTRPVQTVSLAPGADPSAPALAQARRLGGQGRYHEAEQVLLRAMAADPASVPAEWSTYFKSFKGREGKR